jgi:ParB family chromosome partitioning protein
MQHDRDVLLYIGPEQIQEDPDNERDFDTPEEKRAIAELAEALKAGTHVEPPVVYLIDDREGAPMAVRHYQLVSGARRRRAYLAAKISPIPVVLVAKPRSEAERHLARVAANEGRRDIDLIAKARTARKILDTGEYNQAQLAKLWSMSQPALSNLVRLLELPEQVQQWIAQGNLTFGHGKALLGIDAGDVTGWSGEPVPGSTPATVQLRLADAAVKRQASVRDLERDVKQWRTSRADSLHYAENRRKRNADLETRAAAGQLTPKEQELREDQSRQERALRLYHARKPVAQAEIEKALAWNRDEGPTLDHLKFVAIQSMLGSRGGAENVVQREASRILAMTEMRDVLNEIVQWELSRIDTDHTAMQLTEWWGGRWAERIWGINAKIADALAAAGLGSDAIDVPAKPVCEICDDTSQVNDGSEIEPCTCDSPGTLTQWGDPARGVIDTPPIGIAQSEEEPA